MAVVINGSGTVTGISVGGLPDDIVDSGTLADNAVVTAAINADAVKTSAGALHKIPICRTWNLKLSLEFLKESGLQLISCTEKTDKDIYSPDFTNPTAIIMGSEEDGVSPEYLKMSDYKAKIPMSGSIASLNVSVATSIIIYEALRQRG